MAVDADTSSATTASDIPVGGWVDRYVPRPMRPYIRLARLDRPIGTWLLLFPCWWSLAMAYRGTADLWYFALFGIGALTMRGAGCTYNDIIDRNFDAEVPRTRDRPIASGQISVKRAVVFLGAELALGLAVLLVLNPFAIALGAASLAFVFTYPLMKRITYWPQIVLGLTFNWGALLGWAAIQEGLALGPALLYAAGIFWTLGYDTIYAHQDKAYDKPIGIKSTALVFSETTKSWLYGFYAVTVVLLALSGASMGYGWGYFPVLALGAVQLVWQVRSVDLDDPKDCLANFRSNRLFSWILLAGIAAEQAMKNI